MELVGQAEAVQLGPVVPSWLQEESTAAAELGDPAEMPIVEASKLRAERLAALAQPQGTRGFLTGLAGPEAVWPSMEQEVQILPLCPEEQ
jgi:hypothetical protein